MKRLFLFVLALFSITPHCTDKESANTINRQEFCSYANTENINRTIPVINEFLNGPSNSLSDEQKLQELITELKSCPCIVHTDILHISSIYTLPPQSEILISFNENGVTKTFILDISMSSPLRAVGYHESYYENNNDESKSF